MTGINNRKKSGDKKKDESSLDIGVIGNSGQKKHSADVKCVEVDLRKTLDLDKVLRNSSGNINRVARPKKIDQTR